RIDGRLRIGAIEGISGAVNHQPGGLEVRRHVGDLELKGLEIGDVPAKGLALVHVVASLVERRPSRPQRAGANVDAATVEAAHAVLEAVAFDASYELKRWYFDVFQDDLSGRLRIPAHLSLVGAE